MIKNLTCLLMGCVLCVALNAQTKQKECVAVTPDSVFLFSYRPQARKLDTRFGNNRQLLKELVASLQTFRKETDTLYVEGYAGASDNERTNRGTAFRRCFSLKSYLISTLQMRECDFKTRNHPFVHPTEGEAVFLSLLPFVTPPSKRVEKEERVAPQQQTMPQQQPVTQQHPVTEQQPVAEKQPSPRQRYIALKTNLAAWAGTLMNLAAEVQVAKHVSLELPLLWCPWYATDRHAVRTFTLQPEARYWLSAPGRGHYFGLHAHAGWFNVKWNDNRYQDSHRPLLGAGLSYGYLLPLNRHWGAEFTLGAGYANMRYDTYYNIEDGVCFETQTKNYWGVTRVGISLVYRFNAAKR